MKHPGLILEEKLRESGMSRKELSVRADVSEKHISTVINGDKGISSAFARKLGYIFENTAFWLERQAEYDNEQLLMKEQNGILPEETALLKPLKEIVDYFIQRGYMHNGCGEAEKVMQLRELLQVSRLTVIPDISYNAAYRAQVTNNVKVDPYVLFAWQRLCEKETEGIVVSGALDKDALSRKINEIKGTMLGEINDGIETLQNIFAECGIAFSVVKNFRGAPVQGFIKEGTDGRTILCLTIRRQRADTFWFTLFHEIAHLLNGDNSTRFVDFDSVQSEMEERADAFARDMLIPPQAYYDFIRRDDFTSPQTIISFAEELKIMPFIVVGRLQRDEYLDWSECNNLIVKYLWA